MKNEKIKSIVYWIATSLIAANYMFGGVIYLSRNAEVAAGMSQLGYPLYFALILGFWKILGAIAIVVPRFPLVKEWAYAGMVFNLTAAAASNAFVGNAVVHIITPLIALVLVAASWALRPASRTLLFK
ncbi:DoxX-like family protein [Leptospira inadai serovar Lyme str. 10]|uniref:DoxX-like family protein n=2 Tax=Leptospira inadai serovar Lyme TaxID=293084 RepID=V6HHJ5_9LEPT|nr:DoxX family protein [Leptospira inadai]EQA35905.1 DoxX-like family protein [Leptospira inadai serovar Lyme str. 10]PNV76859.1 DoxX family protein [Leptospira inadai serovar Lyme]